MKLLFIVRSTLYTVKGGDTIQVLETARQLTKFGIQTDIKHAHEKIDYTAYDLLHFFNIIRPADMLVHIKKSNKPFVVSSILVDYSLYDKQQRGGFSGLVFRKMSGNGIEYIKNIYRYARAKDKLASTAYLWKGQRRSIKTILKKASCVLVHAEEEYKQLVKLYNENPPYEIIHNGVDTGLFMLTNDIRQEENLVLCVARIEGIKNQYNLIQALNNTKYKLLLVGDAAPNQREYYERCKKIAAANVSFIGYQHQSELIQYYAKAKVHVLPSWFEVCGLSSLEAAAMGCNIVISENGYAKEYFKEDAFYCQPGNLDSIRAAIDKAAACNDNGKLQMKVVNNYTWENAATKTAAIYKKYMV